MACSTSLFTWKPAKRKMSCVLSRSWSMSLLKIKGVSPQAAGQVWLLEGIRHQHCFMLCRFKCAPFIVPKFTCMKQNLNAGQELLNWLFQFCCNCPHMSLASTHTHARLQTSESVVCYLFLQCFVRHNTESEKEAPPCVCKAVLEKQACKQFNEKAKS